MRTVLLVLFVSLFTAACSQPAVNSQANNRVSSNVANSNADIAANANKAAPPLAKVAIDPAADSVYTDISDKVCKERDPKPDSGAIYEAECPGTAGYKLIFSASDHSAALSVIDRQGKETLFPFRAVLKTAMNFMMGDKVEWRMDGKGERAKPVAMIVRLNKFEQPEDQSKTETFLAVIRLAGERCITDLVPASADQNKKAREFADTKGRTCIEVNSE